MFKKQLLLILAICVCSMHGFAQQDSLYKRPVKIDKAYCKSYLLDTRDMIVAPFHWKGRQWITFGATAATATTLLLTSDEQVHNFFQDNRTSLTNDISKYGLEPWGRGIYSMGTMAIFYTYGSFAHNNKAKETALLGLKTYILTGAAVFVAKNIFHRQRPYVHNNPDMWYGPFDGISNYSFPSGHTTSIFAVATIVASEYHEYKIVPVIAYTIAGLTGLSRINDNMHWASDVFTGAVFGWAMGKLIYTHDNWHIRATPYTNGATTGLMITAPLN